MGLAQLIFTKYVFAFEVTSALLITAALGAMVLAHRERLTPKPTQRELSEARIQQRPGAPLPPPGTYARHNAVDMPALLPDGTVSELSVSPVIARRRERLARRPARRGPRGGRAARHRDRQGRARRSDRGESRSRPRPRPRRKKK